jgi:hypothetical protein
MRLDFATNKWPFQPKNASHSDQPAKFRTPTLLNRFGDFSTIRDFPTRRAMTPVVEKMIN